MSENTQIAALPFIFVNDEIEICLISSRRTGRWVIPKGWAKENVDHSSHAATEAYEEAGIIGKIYAAPSASYSYTKKLHTFATVQCLVDIYLLEVTSQNLKWPEQSRRERRWVIPSLASALVEEKELAEILANAKNLIHQ